ncbi:MAG: transglycosylase domain-containing protein [Streptosporangiaceae bacterium]
MPSPVRRAGAKAVGVLIVFTALTGVLVGMMFMPVVGLAGIATRNAARTFDNMPVAGLGVVPSRSEILDSSGRLIAYYYPGYPNPIYRVPVSYHQISPVMRNAIVAIEDSRFWQHGAIDPRGTLRALVSTLSGSRVQGGSTLAQQYVKNACIVTAASAAQQASCDAFSITRKLRELRIAANVEHQMTRKQLLAAYLNVAYFDNQIRGIQVAAQFYFSTTAAKLTLPQAALLAGLVENPAAYDPLVFPKAALARRNVVLARMAQLGFISQATAVKTGSEPLGLHISPVPLQTGCTSPSAAKSAFFCDYVLAVMSTDPTYKQAYYDLTHTGGMKIYTTLSATDQSAASQAVNYVAPANSSYYNPGGNVDTEVLIQPGTGDIRALAVDRPYGYTAGHDSIDYAVNAPYHGGAGVQTGSSSKLFTLVTALEQGTPFGFNLKVRSPTTVTGYTNCQGQPLGPFSLANAEGPSKGLQDWTLYNGTAQSINVFYAHLELKVGLCNVVRTAAAFGVTRADGLSLLKTDPHLPKGNNLSADNYPSFTLGSMYVSPMSMAAAYATVAARGIYCKPIAIRAIVDNSGKHLPVGSADCHRVVSQAVADAANFVLQGVITSGTGTGRSIGIPAAGKTGTANGGYYADWAGYTPLLAGYVSVFNPFYPTSKGAMVGSNACYRDLSGLTCPGFMYGANAPAATWQYTFLHLHLPAVAFVNPPHNPFFTLGNGFNSPQPKPKPKPQPKPKPKPKHGGGNGHG